MDGSRFDAFTRRIGGRVSRRGLLAGVFGLAATGLARDADARAGQR